MQRRKRKNMRVRKDILLALKDMSENGEEYITATQIISVIAEMRDRKRRQIHSVGYPLPTTKTIGNLLRGWNGITRKTVYKESSRVLSYRLTDLVDAQEWLGVTV